MNSATVKNIIKLYNKGYSQNKIGTIIGYSQTTVYKILKENKIDCSQRTHRKHAVNECFFKTWSHDMAYILGFISADGSVDKYTLSFHIGKKDKNILQYIKKYLGKTCNIETKTKSIRIRFNSKKLVSSLRKYNIVPNKTFNIAIDFKIPKKYVGDYVRGVFDGDGWITVRPGKRKGLGFGLCSASKQFILDIKKLSGDIGNIRCRIYKNKANRKPQYYFENSNNKDAIKFRNLIYKNPGFSLKRKKNIFFSRL